MNDGRPVRITIVPLRWPAELDCRDRDDHPGGADHRADRQVELAADHQHAGGHGDDPELRRDLEEVDDAERGEHAAAAGGEPEEDEHQDGPGDGAELGPGHDLAQPRRLAQTLVGGGWSGRHVQPPPGCLPPNGSAAGRWPASPWQALARLLG
jgi:hypothetical protein